MQILIYLFFGGAAGLALVIALVTGGWTWLAPAILVPLAVAYILFDRRLKQREGRQERMTSELP